MKCGVCDVNEAEPNYNYGLNDGSVVPICIDCGFKIYEYTSIKMDRLQQLVELIELVKFKDQESKVKVLKR